MLVNTDVTPRMDIWTNIWYLFSSYSDIPNHVPREGLGIPHEA